MQQLASLVVEYFFPTFRDFDTGLSKMSEPDKEKEALQTDISFDTDTFLEHVSAASEGIDV